MKDMTIEEFCAKHDACAEGRKWALANCSSMQDAWARLKPEWLLWAATQEGVLTDKELRLFAVWCGRRVQHLMTDERSIKALDVAERFANGKATREELTAASDAAWDPADAAAKAASHAASDGAWYAARAAWYAARAAWAAAMYAARAAAEAASWASARAAASDWAEDAKADWLRSNTNPNFKPNDK